MLHNYDYKQLLWGACGCGLLPAVGKVPYLNAAVGSTGIQLGLGGLDWVELNERDHPTRALEVVGAVLLDTVPDLDTAITRAWRAR